MRHSLKVSHSRGTVQGCVLDLVLLGEVVQGLYGSVQARYSEERCQVSSIRGYDDEAANNGEYLKKMNASHG